MLRRLLALQLLLVYVHTGKSLIRVEEKRGSKLFFGISPDTTISQLQEQAPWQRYNGSHALQETGSYTEVAGSSEDHMNAFRVVSAKQASSLSLLGLESLRRLSAMDGSHLVFYGTAVSDLDVQHDYIQVYGTAYCSDGNTTICFFRNRIEGMLRKSGVLSHEISPGKGVVDFPVFFVGFACFSIGACVSLYYEAIRLRAQPENASRDNFLDIAKFILITLVLACHLDLGFPATCRYQVTWDNCDMPAFFIICGMVSKWGDSLLPRKELLRNTFRDCVLGNSLYFLVTSTLVGASTYTGLWFLCAVALYRVAVGFMFQLNIRTFGTLLGSSIALVKSITLTWIWLRGGRDALLYSLGVWCPFKYEINCIAIHAPFFILGLVFQTYNLQRFLRTPVVSCLAGLVWAGWWYVVVCVMKGEGREFSLYGGWISARNLGDIAPGDDVLSSMPIWLWTLAMKAVLALGLIAMAGPLSQASWMSHSLAKLGQRSLYGYVLQMIILYAIIGWGTGVDALGKLYVIHPSVAVLGVTFSMMVLCSPLAEAAFGWLVSPQWALTLADGVCSAMGHQAPSKHKEDVTVTAQGNPVSP